MTKRLLQTRSSVTVNKNMVSRQNIRKKEHIIVKGVTHMISDTTMNGIFYPESEVKLLANTIGTARVTMPASHPTGENGEFISASDPWALTSNFIGAYAFNFSIQDDRLISDVAIDPLFASTSDDGVTIMNAIENGTAIDISTGFYLNVEEKEGFGMDGEPFEMVASNLHIDHSAFLPGEVGAKNKLEGVGLHTNSALTVDGQTIDTDVALLNVNASTPAMKLPLAPNDHVWNESQALENIKVYTNSTDKPSTSFRKFFLNFDQDNVDSFDSYTNLFADVIDGVPHAVKQPITNAGDNDHAKAYVNRFDEVPANNKKGFVKKVLNAIFGKLTGNELSHDEIHSRIYDKLNENSLDDCRSSWPIRVESENFVYRDSNGKLYQQAYSSANDEITFIGERVEVEKEPERFKPIINNKSESIMDKAKIIALLAAHGITANADMSDADLETALNTALSDKLAESAKNAGDKETPAWAANLLTKVDNLEIKLNANADKELDTAVAAVVAMNKGIDEAAAKAMGLPACNAFLAANGQPAFSVVAGQHQTNSKDNCSSLSLPTSKEA